MSRRPSAFTQAEVTRAIKGAVKAGVPADRVRALIDKNGNIVVETKLDSEPVANQVTDEVPFL